MASPETLIEELEEQFMASQEALERDFTAYRTGKASPALVEGIMVDYYGTQTRLRDIAGITTPEPRLLVIQPWDQNALANIEKAIQASDIGISPVSDGRILRLPIPELSEERRQELTRQVHKRAEEAKVAIRNHRRTANDECKKMKKASTITEDDLHDMQEEIQKLTDNYTGEVDRLATEKEEELMSV